MTDIKRKTTVPDPSVGADGEQPISNYSSEIISVDFDEINLQTAISDEEFLKIQQKIARMHEPGYLPTVSMEELYENVYLSKPPIIDGLLYPGTYLLAGAPKYGKSFLVAQMAYCISTGQPFWGRTTQKGPVLYLALEDTEERLQWRMFRMFGVECTADLHFSVTAKKLGAGLEDQMSCFIREHPGTQLIIIDTLKMVREGKEESYSYAKDYDDMGKLKQFADSHKICLLIVHHTRKQSADDKFDMISGTNGLLGCADGALILHKKDRYDINATLEVVGRDIAGQKLYLIHEQEHLCWIIDHEDQEPYKLPPDPLLMSVARIVSNDNPEWYGSPSELADILKTDIKPNMLTRHLNVSASRLLEEHHIHYESKARHEGRRILLKFSPPKL